MIIFQSEGYQIDLGLQGITLNEESNIFVDNMIKSYSFPFNLTMTPALSAMLGFPELDNISTSQSSILGKLVVDDRYFDAELVLRDNVGEQIDAEIYYGEETLPVYDTALSSLPWPLQLPLSSKSLHGAYLDKTWPAVSHNFPAIYRPDIKKENDYEDFELFANNTSGSDFLQNEEATEEGLPVYRNKNVLMPCPYILEMLKFGFEQAGKKIRGNVISDERLNDLIYLPETYMQKFKGSNFSNFQFDFSDRTTTYVGVNVGIYEKSFTPDDIGTYKLKMNLNLDPVTADYFSLRVYQVNPVGGVETPLYNSFSRHNRVNIDEELDIDVTVDNQFHTIWVELTLTYKSESVSDLNSFEYSYKEGRLNELFGPYRLSDYMPDMTFGELVNLLKNWLNLDVTFHEEYVFINFVETALEDFPTVDHTHLEILRPTKSKNNTRTFRLKYSDKSYVLFDKNGQVFSDLDKNEKDIVEVDMQVQMATVESNYGKVTAVYPEGDGNTFALYKGLNNGANTCMPSIDGFTGRVDNVLHNFWEKWLAIRTNNHTIKDKYMAHQSEQVELRSKMAKYNHVLIPIKIRKKRKHQEYWEIEVEAETIE